MATPRHIELARRSIAELQRMPIVDLDVALALAWKRLDAANRPARMPVSGRFEGADWKTEAIRLAVETLALQPLPPPARETMRVMENDRRRHESYSLMDLAAVAEADEEWIRTAREHDREDRAMKVVGPESLRYAADGDEGL